MTNLILNDHCLNTGIDELERYSEYTTFAGEQQQPVDGCCPVSDFRPGQKEITEDVFEYFCSQVDPVPEGFRRTRFGVFKVSPDAVGNVIETYVSGPFGIASRIETDDRYTGLDLVFIDRDGCIKSTVLWNEHLDCQRRVLMHLRRMGLHLDTVSPGTTHPIRELLNATAPTSTKRMLDQHGWTSTRDAFVLGHNIFGNADVILDQSIPKADVSFAGTAEAWKSDLASLAIGNPLSVLAICHALTGPVWRLLGATGHTIHFYGDDGPGISALTTMACSVFGNPEHFRNHWDITHGAASALLCSRNDTFVAFEDLHKQGRSGKARIGRMIGFGTGRTRSNGRGTISRQRSWTVSGMSTGRKPFVREVNVLEDRQCRSDEEHISSIPMAQDERYPSAFPNLHHLESDEELFSALSELVVHQHGTVGRAWIIQLCWNPADYTNRITQARDQLLENWTSEGADQQEEEIRRRFATIAAVGIVCAEDQLLPFSYAEIERSIEQAFCSSRTDRPKILRDLYQPLLVRLDNLLEGPRGEGIKNLLDENKAYVRSDVFSTILADARFEQPSMPGTTIRKVYADLAAAGIVEVHSEGQTTFKKRFGGGERRYVKINIMGLKDVLDLPTHAIEEIEPHEQEDPETNETKDPSVSSDVLGQESDETRDCEVSS